MSVDIDEGRPLLARAPSKRNTAAHSGSLDDERLREQLRRCSNVPGLPHVLPKSDDSILNELKRKLSSPRPTDVEDAPALAKEDSKEEMDGETRRIVRVVYVLAVLTMVVMTTTSPMLLLFMQHVGFASKANVSFYVLAMVVNSSVPVFGHAALGAFAARVGARRALLITCIAISLGLLGMAAAPPSNAVFILAFAVYSLCQSIRVVRTVILTERVPPKQRTATMSLHALMTPIGAIAGPLLWLACERFPDDLLLVGGLRLNMYTLDYMLAAGVSLVMAIIAGLFLCVSRTEPAAAHEGTPQAASSQTENGDEVLHLHMTDGTDIDVNVQRYQRHVFIYFLIIMFSVNVGMGLYTVGFQPILVNVYNASGQELGLIFEIISVLALVPPLLVAFLSNYLKDREILLIGLVAKILGIALFLPIFGPSVYKWQVVAGFILIIKASIFFFTSSMSLFTKLLGGMSNGTLLGILSAGSALGPAAAQLLFAEKTLSFFGSFKYALFGVPVVLATAMVLYPWYWKRLDPDREFTRSLLREYDSVHREHNS